MSRREQVNKMLPWSVQI